MNRLAAGLALVTATACSSNPALAAGQSAPVGPEPPPTLQVSATASVKRAPDVAVIDLAVETLAPSARQASEENAAGMDAVLAAVRGLGIPAESIRTRRLELQPRYERRREEDPEIIGYRAVNQVTVRLDDVERVGAVVDAAVGAGANRVTGIQFELSDPESAYHEALRQAVAKASAEAEVVASALGRRLGEPVQVTTGRSGGPPVPQYRMEAMEMARADMPTPVQPGELEVEATVHIAWRLGS